MGHAIAGYREKVLACWRGKNIGGILGAPTEGYPGVLNFTYYDPVPTEPLPNDDLELQVMNAVALAAMAQPEVNCNFLADVWLNHMDFHCDEYAVALKNLKSGIMPPWSGSFDNYYYDGMGAAIRSELWACLAPGNPALAAAFAREDACIDHAAEGIDAEIFLAALESEAFVCGDIAKLIQCGLRFLPVDSLLKKCIEETCTLWDKHHNWKTVRGIIQQTYASEFRTAVVPNVPFTVLALLAGGGDFGRTICTAVNCGMDTDCTGASAGAIMGIIRPDGIDEKWLAPAGRELVVRPSCITNMKFPATIDDFSELVIALEARIKKSVTPADNSRPDLQKYQIFGEYAVVKNLSWYFVPVKGIDWHPFACNLVYSSFRLPPYEHGQQLLLRFGFDIERDGHYSLMFNSPSSNQIYLDPPPDCDILHDAKDMLFGRMRIFAQRECNRKFPAGEMPVIFAPTLSGAPLNQIKRNLFLTKGAHELIVALEPMSFEREVFWGMGLGDEHCRFINCFNTQQRIVK